MTISFVPQSSIRECGVACLYMILRSKGSNISLSELATRCEVARHGLAASAALLAARSYGYSAHAYSLRLEDLAEHNFPLMIHWQFDHWVVMVGVGRRTVSIIDPAIGHRKIAFEEFSKRFTGVAIEISALRRKVEKWPF